MLGMTEHMHYWYNIYYILNKYKTIEGYSPTWDSLL